MIRLLIVFILCCVCSTTTAQTSYSKTIQGGNSHLAGPLVRTTASLERFEAAVEALPQESVGSRDGFGDAVRKAIRSRRRAGTLSRGRALTLHIRMLSPSFMKKAEDLFWLEYNAGGQESSSVPTGADGAIDRANIDWDGLTEFFLVFIEFMEKLVILLERFA